MADYEQKYQVDYSRSGDNIGDFAQKYINEMSRVFNFLNDLKTNTISEKEPTDPSAGQWKVDGGIIYMRSEDNTEWVRIGALAKNLGFENVEHEVYPVNAVYTGVGATSPSGLFGGTWEVLDMTTVNDKDIYRWVRTE